MSGRRKSAPKTAEASKATRRKLARPERKRHLPPAAAKYEAATALRREKAVELRAQGLVYREIAETLKRLAPEARVVLKVTDSYDESWAYRDVQAELDRIRTESGMKADQLLEIEREQLRMIRRKLWVHWTSHPEDVATADALLRLHDRAMRLEGLHKPAPGSPENPLVFTFVAGDQGLL